MSRSPSIKNGGQERGPLLALLVANMLEAFTSILVILGTPTILHRFDEPLASGGLLLTAYFLPHVALMPLWARLGDVFGRRRVFLASLILYILGSAVALAALSFWWLIIGRIIQGLGNSANEPLAVAIIGDLVAVERRGRALGFWGTAGSIAASVSLVGGPLVDSIGWRSVFLLCIIFGLFSFFLVQRHLPSFPRTGDLGTVDWRGAAMLTAGLALVVTAISKGNDWGWASARFLTLFFAGVLAAFATRLMQREGKEPFLDYSVFSYRLFWFSSLAAAAAVFTLTGATITLPLYLSAVEQLNTSETGIILFINGAGLFLGALAGGVATDRWRSRRPSVFSFSALGISMFMMGAFTTDGVPLIVVAFTLVGFATGMCFAPLTAVITNAFAAQDLSAASGSFNLIRRTGTILGAVAATSILDQRIGILSSVFERSVALVQSYRDTFWILGIVAVAAVFFAFGVRSKIPLQASRVRQRHGGTDMGIR
ncbi:MAG: MFS transporter [Chloroflexi bacterium]|nr:MFS transporter [Chloroflexota bacterium]